MTATAESTDAFSVQHIAPEDISTAASLIYQAYQNDPILQTLLGYNEDNPLDYEKKLRALIREELTMKLRKELATTPKRLEKRTNLHTD